MEIHSQIEPKIIEGREALQRCCSEDPTVRNAAFDQLGQFLLRVAYSRLYGQPGFKQTAEDCAQVALFTIWQKLSQGRGPERSELFMSWCARIVIHKVLDELRKIGRSRAESFDDQSEVAEDWLFQLPDPAAPPPEQQSVEIESKAELVNLIQDYDKLAPEAKFILLYGYLLEWSDEALANHLDRKRSNIRVLRCRALQTLRGDPEFMQRVADLAPFALSALDGSSEN